MQTDHVTLNPWHKRQATLLYHFASPMYLKEILARIDALSALFALLEERSGLDADGIAHSDGNGSQTSKAAHPAAYVHPYLGKFRSDILENIAEIKLERYSRAGESECSRELLEYGDMMNWASREQEDEFRLRAEAVFRFAGRVSSVMYRPCRLDDFNFWYDWQRQKHLFPRIPRFRVRTDVVGVSGQTPPRTGVYVPQEDPMAALQFAWTGGYGELDDTRTLSAFGRVALERVGRAGLWHDEEGLHALINEPRHLHLPTTIKSEREEVYLAPYAAARQSFEGHPCKWYFVEMMEGEYEDHDGSYAGDALAVSSTTPYRVIGGGKVSKSGWWYTLENIDSARYFTKGAHFPELPDDYFGPTYWMWSSDQSAPKLT